MDLPLTGELTFATVLQVLDDAGGKLKSGDDAVTVDLSGVTRSDSAGLALLLELTRLALEHKRQLSFKSAPEQVRELAGFFGLSELLKLT
jgi:phospholipid transport system transporter-binding protein